MKPVFIHIPKTGGTSIRSVAVGMCEFGPPQKSPWTHNSARKMRDLIPDWGQRFSFAFVRNPWSYAVSFHQEVKWPKSFSDFLMSGNLPRQIPLICDEHSNLLVSYVGHFETLERDFAEVARLYGLPHKLPHLGKQSTEDYQKYYNNETYNIIAEQFAEEIAMFRY